MNQWDGFMSGDDIQDIRYSLFFEGIFENIYVLDNDVSLDVGQEFIRKINDFTVTPSFFFTLQYPTPNGRVRVNLHNGMLFISKGFRFGPSGPTFDTDAFIKASLPHDALYAAIRAKKLHPDFRNAADKVLMRYCQAFGMSKLRAWWVYAGVRSFGWLHTKPNKRI